MYAKLKTNGQIQVAPKVLRITISNPSDERLEYEGYRKVIEHAQPDYNSDTQRLECHYEDVNGEIWQFWNVIDLDVTETAESE